MDSNFLLNSTSSSNTGNTGDFLPSRNRKGGEEDQEGWLVSYADMITLLFIFFSVLLSISKVSKVKFEKMSEQLARNSETSLIVIQKQLNQEIQKENLAGQVMTELTDEGLQVRFNEKLLFGSAEAKLNDEGKSVLTKFSDLLLRISGEYRLDVEGHTDSRPIHTAEFASNWSLSSTRAVNILHFLLEKGFEAKRMTVRAYADTRPLKPDSSANEKSQAQNRRVTILLY